MYLPPAVLEVVATLLVLVHTGGSEGGGSTTGQNISNTTIPTFASRRHQFVFNVEPKRKVYDNTNYCHTPGYHVADDHTFVTW